MKTIGTTVMALAALAAMTGWAGESAEFRLDTMDGSRTARTVETIAYSTACRCTMDNAPCQLEQVGVGAGAGEGQNKDIVLNPIQKKPVGRDVAVARSLQVAGKRMVVVLRGKRFAFCKHLDDCRKLSAIRTALEHLLQFPAELLSLADCGSARRCSPAESSTATPMRET